MNVTPTPQRAYLPTGSAPTEHSPWADPSPPDVEAALERMSVRINAEAAQRHSLNRAAEGLRTISVALGFLLDHQMAECGPTPASSCTAAAVEAMRAEVDAVLAQDGVISVGTQRAHLRCAVWQGRKALSLLAH